MDGNLISFLFLISHISVYSDVCPTCKRVNPPKVEKVPLKEEEHKSWLEFKKLDEGKVCNKTH